MPTMLSLPAQRAFDANGSPMMGARLYFFESGTSTPKAIYQDAALSVQHANPLVADSSGVFPAVFMASGPYRVRLSDSGEVQQWQVDGVQNEPSGAEILAALLPVDGHGSGLDADTVDGVQESALAKLADANFTALQVGGIPVGYRGIPPIRGAGGNSEAGWNGRCYATTGDITVGASTHAEGDWFKVFNDSPAARTINRGVGMNMYLAGSDVASILIDPKVSAEFWFNSPTEVSVLGGGSDGGIGGSGTWGTPNMANGTVRDEREYGDAAYAAYSLLSTGARSITGNNPDSFVANWISPQAGMSQFEVQAVLVSGQTPSSYSVLGSGAWFALNANATWSNSKGAPGMRTSVLDITIRQIGTVSPTYVGRITIIAEMLDSGLIAP